MRELSVAKELRHGNKAEAALEQKGDNGLQGTDRILGVQVIIVEQNDVSIVCILKDILSHFLCRFSGPIPCVHVPEDDPITQLLGEGQELGAHGALGRADQIYAVIDQIVYLFGCRGHFPMHILVLHITEVFMEQTRLNALRRTANNIRLGIIEGVYNAGCGHPGGSLSIADILTYLYFEEMNVNPADPKCPTRDRFVLSKGHTAPALYATLAERGYFPKEVLKTLRKTDSHLQGHPDMKNTPGVDMTTGSLGLGFSAACGMALSGKVYGEDYRVYAVVGDGESEEGQVWEAAMFAAHYKLDNLVAILDWNGLQIDGPITEVMNPTPHDEKFRAFGWHVITISAHDFSDIERAFAEAREVKGKPTVIIAKSTKGKGVSYMENSCEWHGQAPKEDLYKVAIADLEKIAEGLK